MIEDRDNQEKAAKKIEEGLFSECCVEEAIESKDNEEIGNRLRKGGGGIQEK